MRRIFVNPTNQYAEASMLKAAGSAITNYLSSYFSQSIFNIEGWGEVMVLFDGDSYIVTFNNVLSRKTEEPIVIVI